MDVPLDHPADDNKRLQRCINDLVSVLALPAIWSGREPSQVVYTLLDALMPMVQLDLAYVRLNDVGANASLEAVRLASTDRQMPTTDAITKHLSTSLTGNPSTWPPLVTYPVEDGHLSILPLRLGLDGQLGVLAAGSLRADFPDQTERLVLSVAANHAAVGLREADLLTRHVVDSIPAQAWIAGPDGGITFVNQRWMDYTGLSLDESRGWAWATTTNLFHPEDLPGVLEIWKGLLSSGQPGEAEARLRRVDGEYRWYLIRTVPAVDARGTVIAWYGINTDIHARKVAEEKLQRSETEYRQIIEAIPQYIAALSPNGELLYANSSLLEYSGLNEEDLAADNVMSQIVLGEDLQRLSDERQSGLDRGVPFELEMRLRHRSGPYRWCLIQYKPLKDEQGRVLRWYATGTDIDDRRRAEDRVKNENLALREEISRSSMFEEIVGSSGALTAVLRQVAQVAASDTTVLITGETGTGKELVARAIHQRSTRSTRAFVSVNCAAIAPSLMASELFGHERGAFTGAFQRREGRFELADGGTLFLDEVGELPADIQVALLRVLQERQFERVGGSNPIRVDVRIIAATNRDLEAAVGDKSFRSDLFYRLNVFPIEVPPLRERSADIPLLVEYFVHRFGKQARKKLTHISGKTLALLQAYSWPGNIRELQNVIERAVIVSGGETLVVDERWLLKSGARRAVAPLDDDLVAHERARIEAALAESRGRVSGPTGAAARLGVPRSTLESKIRALKVNKHRFKAEPS